MKLLFSDKKIIEALQGAKELETDKAFRYLYKTHYPMALQFVKNNSGGADDAADVFQDVLVAFYQNVRNGTFKGDSAIKTYLYAMIRNKWLVKLKKNSRMVKMEEPEKASAGTQILRNENPDEALQKMVESMLEKVGERCRILLKLYYFDNLSMSEIAGRSNFDNENSAKTQKYKCMQKLIKIMADKPQMKKTIYELFAASE